VKKELENSKTAILVRMKTWQKDELEEEARKQNRSVNNLVLTELGRRRKWKDRDPETGGKKEHPYFKQEKGQKSKILRQGVDF